MLKFGEVVFVGIAGQALIEEQTFGIDACEYGSGLLEKWLAQRHGRHSEYAVGLRTSGIGRKPQKSEEQREEKAGWIDCIDAVDCVGKIDLRC